MTPIILAIIQAGVIPEIMQFIRDRWTRTGSMPTDQEVIDRVHAMADAIIAKGEAWLAAHPPTDPIP